MTMSDLPYRPCVGIMVLNREGKVWVGRRAKAGPTAEASAKLWQMPQGGIDVGEDPLKAARRELWEETGISSVALLAELPDWLYYDLPNELQGVALKGKFRGQAQRWFAFRFEGDEAEINIEKPPDGAAPEFDRWEWVDMQRLPERIVPFKREIYQSVVNGFEHLVRTSSG